MSTPTTSSCYTRPQPPPTAADSALETYLAERTNLLAVAHRVVGDHAAAEDVVQDVWVKWQRVDHTAVENPAAFLTTATRRVAINVVRSAHHRNELPAQEPTDRVAAGADPSEHVERVATIEESIGLLMTRLSPAELAALVLRTCFDYAYGNLADILGTTMPHARQLVRRARLALASDRARPVDHEQRRRLVAAFTRATEAGDLAELVELLGAAARRSREARRIAVVRAA